MFRNAVVVKNCSRRTVSYFAFNIETNAKIKQVGNIRYFTNSRCLSQAKSSIRSSDHNHLSYDSGVSKILTDVRGLDTLNLARFFSSDSNLPSHVKVTLPALSPTMESGTLISWEKKEGDKLNEGDLLAEIETDKATMGFETPEEGYLAKILISAGTKDIPIGKLLCIIVEKQENVAAFKDYVDTSEPAKASKSATETKPIAQSSTPPQPARPAPSQAKQPSVPQATGAGVAGRILASPLARRLAAEKGLDLSNLIGSGSGPEGRIRSQDVLNAPTTVSGGPRTLEFSDVQLSNMRQVIAKRLLQSKQSIPHYYLTVECEVDELLRLREQLNEMLTKENTKISLNDFIVKASALACIKVPETNSSWQDTFIRQYSSVDVSVAVSTENGLITPIVFGAERKGVKEISQEVKELAIKARDGNLQPSEFQGGTFTISNLGMYGIRGFSAVINPPQACILAVGTTQRIIKPDRKGSHRAVSVINVTLSCDHRVVDGAIGAQWLQAFKEYVEKPFSMIL